jgi:hypothetical protein
VDRVGRWMYDAIATPGSRHLPGSVSTPTHSFQLHHECVCPGSSWLASGRVLSVMAGRQAGAFPLVRGRYVGTLPSSFGSLEQGRLMSLDRNGYKTTGAPHGLALFRPHHPVTIHQSHQESFEPFNSHRQRRCCGRHFADCAFVTSFCLCTLSVGPPSSVSEAGRFAHISSVTFANTSWWFHISWHQLYVVAS